MYYPSWEELRAEDREVDPVAILTVRDESGAVVRRVTGSTGSGFHRVAWDLRYPASVPVRLDPLPMDNPFFDPPTGPMVVPGTYSVSLAISADGEVEELAGPETFVTVPLGTAKLPADDRRLLLAFQAKVARLQRAVLGASEALVEARERVDLLQHAIGETPAATAEQMDAARDLELALADLDRRLTGDRVVASRNEPTPPSIRSRVQRIVGSQWSSSAAPTETNRQAYEIAGAAFSEVLADLRRLVEGDLAALEETLESMGAPWTPGRLPRWEPES